MYEERDYLAVTVDTGGFSGMARKNVVGGEGGVKSFLWSVKCLRSEAKFDNKSACLGCFTLPKSRSFYTTLRSTYEPQ